MKMAVLKRGRNVIRVAGAAGVAAPYVREIVRDAELRNSLRTAFHSIGRLYEEMSADERLRDVLFSSASHADGQRASIRMRMLGENTMLRSALRRARIASFGLGAIVLVGAVAYPRSRRRITKAVGDTRGTVTNIASKASEKTVATAGSAREKLSSTVQRLRPAA